MNVGGLLGSVHLRPDLSGTALLSVLLAFRTSRKVGVVVSVKPGQMYLGLARWLTGLLKGRGYEAELSAFL
jgi:hypothetical protein